MRPLELELEGFTSFRQRTSIALRDLDLFAITGPTGAGKTSVLDALVFALYGRTPRLLKEPNQLVSRGLKHMRVRLDFAVGERTYRVARNWKGANSEAILEEIADGRPKHVAGKTRDVGEAINQLIGLDFDSFIRSVVLPQGEFDLFLKGEPKERQKILHHLLRMGIYRRVQELAQERATERNRESQLLEHQVKELDGATPEALAEGRETLARCEAEAQSLADLLRRMDGVQELATTLVSELEKASAARVESERIAADHERAAAKLEAMAEREAQAERARAELEKKLAGNPFDEKLHLALEKSEAEARNLRNSETARARTVADHERATKKIAELEKSLASAAKRLERGEETVAAAVKGMESARAARDELMRRFGSAARVATHLGIEENRLRTQAERTEKEASRIAAVAELEKKRKELAAARKAEEKAAAEREQANAALEEAQRAHAALELRHHLHRGVPCPVCEQPVDKLPPKRKLAGLEEARTALAKADEVAAACIQTTARLAAKLQGEEERIRELDRELKRLASAQDSAAAKLEAYLGAPPDAETHARLEQAQSACERAEKALSEATEKHQSAEREAAQMRARRDGEAADLAAEKKASAMHERLLAENDRAIAEIQARIAAVVGSAPDLIRALEQSLEASRRAKAQRDEIAKKMEGEVKRVAAAREEAAATRAHLAALDTKRADIAETIRKADEGAAEARTYLSPAAGEIELRLPESANGHAERQVVARRLTELQEARVALEGKRALAAKHAETIAGDIEKRAQLTTRLEETKGREKIARRLAEDLRTDRFVAFLVEEALQVLAADASAHLQNFPGGGFSLAVDGQDFLVIDHANADERRSVKTLSGGESFNASLALAIAFAENLADLPGAGDNTRAALDSLFIDEGFGTLDTENLDAVASAIESIYAQGRGRMVGIITHIPELAQRMPARIVVTKPGNTSHVCIESG